jgi:hypothetical protein
MFSWMVVFVKDHCKGYINFSNNYFQYLQSGQISALSGDLYAHGRP